MRRRTQLYVAGRPVDLGDDSFILYNWTREDAANPTAVVNSSSHQIQLPGTCRNNAVFGAAFRLDRRTVFGIGYHGPQFDPTRKTPFVIYGDDGTVLESGYCRLDAVNTHDRIHSYTVTLFGGLGSFFYALDTTEDGTQRSLKGMIWQDIDGEDVTDFYVVPVASDTVQDAWDYLAGGTPANKWWNIVNFAPCYNGIPQDFDAKHGLSSHAAYENVYEAVTDPDDDSIIYTYKAGASCALLTFPDAHTEWEVGDLRWYLQRPVVSVKAFFAAICDPRNNGGYTVTLDPTFFAADNPAYNDAWWTLPLVAPEDRNTGACLTNLLASTKSPMRYLVDYCKVYGLMFLCDGASKTVQIVTRATFYGSDPDVIDMTSRIDRSQEIRQDPVLADRRFYQLGDGGKGAFADQYRRDYGRGYAIQRIDTGYEFDMGVKVLTDGLAFADAAEVQESNRLFASLAYIGYSRIGMTAAAYETVMEELWNGGTSFQIVVPRNAPRYPATIVPDTASAPGIDWLPKLQLHDADGKALDGADVLLYFSGFVSTPVIEGSTRKAYHLTDDSGTMQTLAGAPCWDLTRTGHAVTSLPSFRRVVLSDRFIVDSYEWGVSPVRPVPGISMPSGQDNSIFGKWWKAYLSDRYAADTRVLTCMADLRGLPVGQALLRRFCWYDGALWTFNAIRNHSFTTLDLTEVELVKVQDMDAYTTGPGSVASHYLRITPSPQSVSFLPAGESLTFTIRSTSAWSLDLSALTPWLNASAASGPAGTSTLVLTATANDTDERRTVSMDITNEDGDTVTMTLSQAPRPADTITVSPSAVEIPGEGGGASVAVGASSAWAVSQEDIPAWLTVQTSDAGITFVAAENGGAARTASIRVYLTSDSTTYVAVSVTQAEGTGGTGGLTLLDSNGNASSTVGANVTSLTLQLTAPDGASWTVSEDAAWVGISPASGTGSRSIAVALTANTGAAREVAIVAQRSGFSTPVTYYLHQEAGSAAPTLTLLDGGGNDGKTVGASATSFSIYVAGTDGKAWTLSNGASAFASVSPASGTGNKTLTVSVQANSGDARQGAIIVTCDGQTATFYLQQEAGATTQYIAEVTRHENPSYNYDNYDSTAQNDAVSIYVYGTGASWQLSSNTSWIHPSSGSWASGTGDGTGFFRIDTNTGAARQGVIVCTCVETGATTEFYVYQDGGGQVHLNANFSPSSIDAQSRTVDLVIDASAGLAWTIGSVSSALTPYSMSGTGPQTVTVYVDENTGSARFLSLIVSADNYGISTVPGINQAAPVVADYLRVMPFGSVAVANSVTSQTFHIESSLGWRVINNDADVTVTPRYGSGDGTVVVSFPANASTQSARSIPLTFQSTTGPVITVYATIVQDAAPSYIRVTPFGTIEVSYNQVQSTFSLESSHAWTASCNVAGVTISPASGSAGSAGVTVAYGGNETSNVRSIPVTFTSDAGDTVTVTISQTPNVPDTFIVSPASLSFDADAGSQNVLVTASSDWSAGTSAGWFTLQPSSGGSGNSQQVRVTCARNTGGERTGTITFRSGVLTRTVTVTQAAGTAGSISAYPSAVTVNSVTPVAVTVFSDGPWHVETLDRWFWLSATPASGQGSADGDTLNLRSTVSSPAMQTYNLKIYNDATGEFAIVSVTKPANA